MKRILLLLSVALMATASFAQNYPVIGTPEADRLIPQKSHLLLPEGTRAIKNATPKYLRHDSKPKILTILATFNDKDTFSVKNPRAAFNEFFNKKSTAKFTDFGNGNTKNYGSVAQYFSDMSGGNFEPEFVIYGPVKLPGKETVYGGTSKDGGDENPYKLVQDAVDLLTDSIKDASQFDSDNDGYIDCIYVIYAGVGQNYQDPKDPGSNVWACTSFTTARTIGGKKTGWFSIAAEIAPLFTDNTKKTPIITGIGTTCHELTHAMGIADVYPTYSSAHIDNQEMEYWDLMDGGEYTNNGYNPTAYTAWEKMIMGWPVNIQTLNKDQKVTMSKSTEEGGVVYKIENPDGNIYKDKKLYKEYFLLENIKRAKWNSKAIARNGGLMVYHVNMPDTVSLSDKMNNTAGIPNMAIVPADSAILSSYNDTYKNEEVYADGYSSKISRYLASMVYDLYPSYDRTTELSDEMGIPNFYWYTSKNKPSKTNSKFYQVNKALKNIKLVNGTITFDYIHDVSKLVTGINEVDVNKTENDMIYTLNGVAVGTDLSKLPKGIYIRNHKKFIVK